LDTHGIYHFVALKKNKKKNLGRPKFEGLYHRLKLVAPDLYFFIFLLPISESSVFSALL